MQLDGSTQLCSIFKASDFFRAMSNRAFPYVLDDPYEETGEEVSSSKGTGKGKKGKKGKKGGLPNAAGGSSASGKGKPGAGNVAEDEEGKGRKGYEVASPTGHLANCKECQSFLPGSTGITCMAKCSLLALMFTKWLLSKMDKFFARPVKMTAQGLWACACVFATRWQTSST